MNRAWHNESKCDTGMRDLRWQLVVRLTRKRAAPRMHACFHYASVREEDGAGDEPAVSELLATEPFWLACVRVKQLARACRLEARSWLGGHLGARCEPPTHAALEPLRAARSPPPLSEGQPSQPFGLTTRKEVAEHSLCGDWQSARCLLHEPRRPCHAAIAPAMWRQGCQPFNQGLRFQPVSPRFLSEETIPPSHSLHPSFLCKLPPPLHSLADPGLDSQHTRRDQELPLARSLHDDSLDRRAATSRAGQQVLRVRFAIEAKIHEMSSSTNEKIRSGSKIGSTRASSKSERGGGDRETASSESCALA